MAADAAYRDQISVLDDDYEAVHEREGRLRRVGNNVLTAPAAREVHFTSDSWQQASSWAPVDDPEYALDPDGEWYDDAIEMPVMQEVPLLRKKRKKSQISVSVFLNKNKMLYGGRIHNFLSAAATSRCLARSSSPGIS